jgi:16S rRNA (uracil1498-N3)-methyltransferase
MRKFFVRHKLSIDDITHLSDSDSKIVIAEKVLKVEDPIEVETYEKRYLAQIIDIKKNSVEIMILEELGDRESEYIPSITIIQSLSNDSKFNFFIEKSVEVGIEKIIPVESQYSLKTKNKATRDWGYWNKLVRDATEQSRNIFPTIIEKPLLLKELNNYAITKDSIKICLATEAIDLRSLEDVISSSDLSKPVYIAIGPEKGWSPSDLEVFKNLNFQFIKLKGNILRTETTGLVISSIFKYMKGEI